MPTIVIQANTAVQFHRPANCAVLVALPLSKEQFLENLRSDVEGNFAKAFRSNGRETLPESTVAELYETSANLARDVLKEVSGRGVKVVPNGSTTELCDLLLSHRVVTLFAHSRDARFLESDVRNVGLLFDALGQRDSEFYKIVVRFGVGCPTAIPPRGSSVMVIVRFLNRLLEAPTTRSSDSPIMHKLGDITRDQLQWRKRREQLECALPHAFRSGAGLEFQGAFQRLDHILQSLPREYDGTFDLTCCNSTVFAEDVRRRYRRSLVMSNELPASFEYRMAVYRQVMRILSRTKTSYEEAVFRIRK
jgi:hypothetical protein